MMTREYDKKAGNYLFVIQCLASQLKGTGFNKIQLYMFLAGIQHSSNIRMGLRTDRRRY